MSNAHSKLVRLPAGVTFSVSVEVDDGVYKDFTLSDNAKHSRRRSWVVWYEYERATWTVTLSRSIDDEGPFDEDCKVSKRMQEYLIALCMMLP